MGEVFNINRHMNYVLLDGERLKMIRLKTHYA